MTQTSINKGFVLDASPPSRVILKVKMPIRPYSRPEIFPTLFPTPETKIAGIFGKSREKRMPVEPLLVGV